ncbi:hypothetical protein JCM11641_003784 [Rhodosporidiobolus odoratus]
MSEAAQISTDALRKASSASPVAPAEPSDSTSSSTPQPPSPQSSSETAPTVKPTGLQGPAVDQHADPQVAQLRALFPATDVEVVEAVLASCGGSQDAAIHTLLQLNDPDYKPENPDELSQLEADEELARQLAHEDGLVRTQHRPQRSSSMPTQRAAPQQQQPLAYQPYVSKTRRTAGPASPSMGSWEPPQEQSRQPRESESDELDQLTEQFTKLADTGKKLFGNFLTKAKEQMVKVDEMVAKSASPSSSSSSQPPPLPPKPERTGSWQIPSALPRPAHAPAREATSSELPDFSGPSAVSTSTRSQTPSPARAAPASSSKDKPLPTTTPEPVGGSSLVATTSPTIPSSPAVPTSPAKASFTGKIPGLLPRQSFSLLDQPGKKDGSSSPAVKSPLAAPGSSSVASTQHLEEKSHYSLGDDDSEDDMEYVKSPFDDD